MATRTAQTTGQTAGPTGTDRRWSALVVIAVAQLMVALDATIVNIALPTAQRDLVERCRSPALDEDVPGGGQQLHLVAAGVGPLRLLHTSTLAPKWRDFLQIPCVTPAVVSH